MPNYVNDPDNPGKKINALSLQARHPDRVMPPVMIERWMKHDVWTRREAMLLLAGYDPSTEWDESSKPFVMKMPGHAVFLDGTSSTELCLLHGISHPLTCLNFNQLVEVRKLMYFSMHTAISCGWPGNQPPGFWIQVSDPKPYWLEYVQEHFPQYLVPPEDLSKRR